MILIASAAYLQGEFASEVGLLPPCFLPVGNKRLYEYQIQFLDNCKDQGEDVYLSVPLSYELNDFDTVRLNELGVQVLFVPDGLSLGESLLYSWNASAKHYSSFSLLHGDTLFLNGCFKSGVCQNLVSVHSNHGFYKRASLGSDLGAIEKMHDDWSNDSEHVLSGFFRFSNPLFFMKSLVESKNDFIKGIVRYHQEFPLELASNGEWLDFGHINSFYHSRTKMTTQRAFNELTINSRSVSKASCTKSKKIFAEGSWFANLPLPLRLYTPALLGLDSGGDEFENANYQIEYLYLLPLSDLFVFSRLRKDVWRTVFKSISEMLAGFARYPVINIDSVMIENANKLYLEKTLERLNEFSEQTGFDCKDRKLSFKGFRSFSLNEVAIESARFINGVQQKDLTICHGDLCLSNMLFDSRVQAIKCIDPRGMTSEGKISLYGDRRYDLAKLYHSVVGLYDFIIAGRYFLEVSDDNYDISFSLENNLYDDVLDEFRDVLLKSSGYEEKEILAITVHLFLSMLPLHSDRPERQEAFIANSLALFSKLLRV